MERSYFSDIVVPWGTVHLIGLVLSFVATLLFFLGPGPNVFEFFREFAVDPGPVFWAMLRRAGVDLAQAFLFSLSFAVISFLATILTLQNEDWRSEFAGNFVIGYWLIGIVLGLICLVLMLLTGIVGLFSPAIKLAAIFSISPMILALRLGTIIVVTSLILAWIGAVLDEFRTASRFAGSQ